MRIVRFSLALGTLVTVLGLTPVQSAEPAGDINISVVQTMFREVPSAMAKVLAKPLTNVITRKTGLTGGEIEVVADALTLADQLKSGKCQLGVFHGFEFAWAKKHNPDLVPLVITVYPTGSPQAVVVVHKENQASSLADLKGTNVTVPKGSRGHCYLYLDGQKTGVAGGTPPANAEEALSAIVAGTSPATVVDAAALVGYEKLQPGAFKQLRVLAESERFPQNVIAYQRGAISETNAGKIREALTDAHTTASGKPLMMLWNIVKFDAVPGDYAEQLDKVAKTYPTPVKIGGPSGSGGR